jgi:polyphosphate kinase
MMPLAKSLSTALSELQGQAIAASASASSARLPAPEYTGLHATAESGEVQEQQQQFLDRDHCILAFNERVLDWAVREDVPLLERLRYLCIVSSNLDEWVRGALRPACDGRQGRRRQGPVHPAELPLADGQGA